MNRRVVATVPGKLILMGEHAAVYGRPALVAAVNPRAWVEIDLAEAGLEIELVDFHRTFETTWQEASDQAQSTRRAWQDYLAAPTPDHFAKVGSGSPESLVTVALGELAGASGEQDLPPLTLRLGSKLPVGSGFGSSAAIAVAIVGGVLALLNGHIDLGLVDSLAMEVERRQHGLPSGVDHKTVLYGGVVLAERQPGGELKISRLQRSSPMLELLQVYQTGQPAETTGEVVAAVRRRRDENPAEVEALLERMGLAVEGFRAELEAPAGRPPIVGELIREYQGCLEDLGVVPAAVRETIRQVEARGGAAKISGAGALTGATAGCLLVHWPSGPPDELPPRLLAYQRQDVELGATGLSVEESR